MLNTVSVHSIKVYILSLCGLGPTFCPGHYLLIGMNEVGMWCVKGTRTNGTGFQLSNHQEFILKFIKTLGKKKKKQSKKKTHSNQNNPTKMDKPYKRLQSQCQGHLKNGLQCTDACGSVIFLNVSFENRQRKSARKRILSLTSFLHH